MKDYDKIKIQGARQNNLDNISLEIPKYKWVTVCGVSGSGKSSLVHDVIYEQAQHDFLETLTSYARRSFPKTPNVDCDFISGLSPCVVIDQNTFPNTPRSTVGTYTDIYSHLRLLFSRAGNPQYNASAFSFNHPDGVCENCNGLGTSMEPDISALLDLKKSLNEGAIKHKTWKVGGRYWNIIKEIERFDMDKPVEAFTDSEMHLLLYSPPFHYEDKFGKRVESFSYEGIVGRMKKRMNDERGLSSATYDRQFFKSDCCPVCNGIRISQKAASVELRNGCRIGDLVNMEIYQLHKTLQTLEGSVEGQIVPYILKELQNLMDVGVGYLTLNRSVSTLSGGEAHKVKLARQLGNTLSDLIYVLDEPTAGLHARDIDRIIRICHEIVNKHNTLIVIDHSLQMLKEADYMIEVGRGSGKNGGKIIAQGISKDVLEKEESVTAAAVREFRQVMKSSSLRTPKGYLEIGPVTRHNLRNFSVKVPLGVFTSITGVSGAGKSTLLNELIEHLPEAVLIGQENIGRNVRGNIGTYTKVFDKIRKYFSTHTGANASLFSFNSEGACPNCSGLGYIVTDMHFMGDIHSMCEECNGRRYKRNILELTIRGKNITDILDMTITEALAWFQAEKDIVSILQDIYDVGLGYITLGQPLNTLSGGEMQRLKLSSRLKGKKGIYLIDEPTKGLHMKDISELIGLLNHIVDLGNTVIVVEHNLDVICQSDWIIDLGPEGGMEGGQLMFSGVPAELYEQQKLYGEVQLSEQEDIKKTGYTRRYMKAYIDERRKMNIENFMNKYGLRWEDQNNAYLSKWNNYFRSKRPVISCELEYTVCQSGKTVQIWIHSGACRFSRQGGCTSCDYLEGVTGSNQLAAFEKAMGEMQDDTDTIVLNTCGSVLDEMELKWDVLIHIVNLIKKAAVKTLVLETHIMTIHEEILKTLQGVKGDLDIYFEVGIESLNDEVIRFILNKIPFQRDIKGMIDTIHKYGFHVTGNVMVGFPFMDRDMQIYDGLETIRTLFSYGIDFMVLFPVNIKKYTLMHHLYEKGIYKRPDGRILLDILLEMTEEKLEYINVAWYGEPRLEIPGYEKSDMTVPFYCDKCYGQMMKLWLAYNCEESGAERRQILLKMNENPCECKSSHKTKYYSSGINYAELDACYEMLKSELGDLDGHIQERSAVL